MFIHICIFSSTFIPVLLHAFFKGSRACLDITPKRDPTDLLAREDSNQPQASQQITPAPGAQLPASLSIGGDQITIHGNQRQAGRDLHSYNYNIGEGAHLHLHGACSESLQDGKYKSRNGVINICTPLEN